MKTIARSFGLQKCTGSVDIVERNVVLVGSVRRKKASFFSVPFTVHLMFDMFSYNLLETERRYDIPKT